ncbi:hypothetical protein [Halomonas saccharevitans]|uniref:Uncharacterized protein n=1 Tax=Halomonas saccharevitans TaxID=416872 RepID=A0A1I7CAW1_9GAMM|nr:hypothetical protein [Halomonas saccharevitans]SFT96543.1 hypothetical protein SAMN04487956_13940 [Halomonas saccharevitans]
MGQCRFCERKGFFLSVDTNGLCENCAPQVLHDITQRHRIIEDCLRLARDGKTFATRLSRCDLLFEHLEHLLQYENKGIPTLTPSPSDILSEFKGYRDKLIIEEAQKVAQKAKEKSEVASTITAKHNALANGLLKSQEIIRNTSDASVGEELERGFKYLMYKVKLDGFLEAAKKAEFKGNNKKAIDQYQEALFLIRNDDIPDDQQGVEIQQIEAKLIELGA